MAVGKVKWFDDARGYGFIEVDGRKKDIFVHYSGITSEDRKRRTLVNGETVQFDIAPSDKGEKAVNVSRLAK